MKNINKNRQRYVPFMLSDVILAQWRRPAASSEALDLLHWAMCMVSYQHTAAAIKMANKVGPFFVVVLFAVALAATGAIWSK
jgi:hypothetical protein